MKMAVCPFCRVLHEAVGAGALDSASDEQAYRITHCRLCESPSSTFVQRPDMPEVADDEFGYPLAVVPWLDASVLRKPSPPKAPAPASRRSGTKK
jgi:hypothetical protein